MLLIKFSFRKKVGAFICISKLDGVVTWLCDIQRSQLSFTQRSTE